MFVLCGQTYSSSLHCLPSSSLSLLMPDGTQLLVTSKNNCNSVVDLRTHKIVKQKTSQEEVG